MSITRVGVLNPPSILSIPHDLLQHVIFSNLDPKDLCRVARTCSLLKSRVYADPTWRLQFRNLGIACEPLEPRWEGAQWLFSDFYLIFLAIVSCLKIDFSAPTTTRGTDDMRYCQTLLAYHKHKDARSTICQFVMITDQGVFRYVVLLYIRVADRSLSGMRSEKS